MGHARGELRIGTSGWRYDHWRQALYGDRPEHAWFARYAETFDTVEVNNTFYGLPDADSVDGWREAAPPGFRFALKYSRYGSHMKRLKDPEQHLPAFLERAERLGAYLGPVLVQLPPRWSADTARLARFLEQAPRRLRWAFEFRDPSWLCDEVAELLAEHDAARCVHDLLPDHPHAPTASWVYQRFHGPDPERAYTGSYPHQRLSAEAERLREQLHAGRDVYAYFNNDQDGHAVRDASDLRRYAERP